MRPPQLRSPKGAFEQKRHTRRKETPQVVPSHLQELLRTSLITCSVPKKKVNLRSRIFKLRTSATQCLAGRPTQFQRASQHFPGDNLRQVSPKEQGRLF